MLILSLNELKLIARSRGINDYKSMSKKRLLSALNKSETVNVSEKNFDNARIKKIRKGFNELRGRFKPKIKEIRKNLYETENKKNLSKIKNKRDWEKSSWIIRKSF